MVRTPSSAASGNIIYLFQYLSTGQSRRTHKYTPGYFVNVGGPLWRLPRVKPARQPGDRRTELGEITEDQIVARSNDDSYHI
jgi:hypothetical protein